LIFSSCFPIGRRGAAPRRRNRAPSLRHEIARLAEQLARVEPLLQTIAVELTTAACERRRTNETLDRVARQIVELRHDRGLTELHIAPRRTRRRPLG
jgi:hypothetical protein